MKSAVQKIQLNTERFRCPNTYSLSLCLFLFYYQRSFYRQFRWVSDIDVISRRRNTHIQFWTFKWGCISGLIWMQHYYIKVLILLWSFNPQGHRNLFFLKETSAERLTYCTVSSLWTFHWYSVGLGIVQHTNTLLMVWWFGKAKVICPVFPSGILN